MTTFAIATLGCKVNTYESQHYLESMKESGYTEVSFREAADVYIINTCCVTNTATAKSRQKIHQARKQNPQAIIALIGCYAQTASADALAALQADVIIGAGEKGTLAQRITQALQQRPIQAEAPGDARALRVFEPLNIHSFSHQSRAFLKVQDGCNQFCSYCIIPYARGSERSIDPTEAVAIASQMAAHGHQEIVLSGIHTGRYGRERGTSLLELLKELTAHTPAHVRYRISSIEMNEIDDALIAFMQEEERIARHLHIPIQAADDDVLKAMNRPYDTAWFMKRMNEIMEDLQANPPMEIAGLKVQQIDNYITHESKNLVTGEVSKIDLPKSKVLAYHLEGGAKVIIRPSGTEPKIKAYYTTIASNKADAAAQQKELAADFSKKLGF